MKCIHPLLLIAVTVAVLEQTVRAQDDTAADQTADEAALAKDEKEVNEVIQDMKEDEAKLLAAAEADETKVTGAEEDVKHEQEIFAVKIEDVQEMLEDIRDDQVDKDAEIIERKLNDVKFAKDQSGKSNAQRRKEELANKKKRNEERKKKREERTKKHADRHKKVDKLIEVMRQQHPNNTVASDKFNLKDDLPASDKTKESQERAEVEAVADQAADEATLAVDEKEVNEIIQDMKEDEAKVVTAPEVDEKKVTEVEEDVKHEEEIFTVKMEDVQEILEDIQDDQVDKDAEIIERKLDDFKFAKDQSGKSDAERRKAELVNKKKRNEERKKKREERAKKHADRHNKVDKFMDVMRKQHPNDRI